MNPTSVVPRGRVPRPGAPSFRTRVAGIAAAWLVVVASGAFAQDYPDKPVRLVDPYAPGGSTGVVSRAIAKKFQEQTGQQMLVDNRPGAGSNIGSDMVAKAAPDGYTLLLGTSSLAINASLYRTLAFDPQKDLAPIVGLIRAPNVLAVNAALPVRSVQELIAYARAHPGELNYGSSGNGATNHMAMEMFKTMAGLKMTHVPYKGGGEALTALLGGQIQVLFNPASTLMPHHQAGRLRTLAVSSDKRVEGLDLPTVAESGLPGFESSVWFGLFAPSGTPASIVAKVNAEINRALKDNETEQVLQKAGMNPIGGTPDQLRTLLQQDTARWAAVIKASGARLD
jgi:tripartite-type tricarboxylate transporter receptor subunit TctC